MSRRPANATALFAVPMDSTGAFCCSNAGKALLDDVRFCVRPSVKPLASIAFAKYSLEQIRAVAPSKENFLTISSLM